MSVNTCTEDMLILSVSFRHRLRKAGSERGPDTVFGRDAQGHSDAHASTPDTNAVGSTANVADQGHENFRRIQIAVDTVHPPQKRYNSTDNCQRALRLQWTRDCCSGDRRASAIRRNMSS